MTIPLNQNINRAQTPQNAGFGLSSLNAAYLKRAASNPVQNPSNLAPAANAPVINPAGAGVQAPMGIQNNAQALAQNQMQTQTPAPVMAPNSAYMPGVGTVPSGYFLPGDSDHSGEAHIIKKTPLTNARIMADKIVKDIFVYAPKGMQGSKNSNFYEYIALGTIPYVLGSAGLIATSNLASRFFNPNDARASKLMGKNTAMGVLLFAGMKWLGNKVINKGASFITGVDIETPYKKTVVELPENGGKGKNVTEYHRVFESLDFPYWALLEKEGEEKGNKFEIYDNVLKKKLGCKEPVNDPAQVVQPLVNKAFTKATATKYIASYLWAALGVAIAAQKPFSNFMSGYKGHVGPLKFMKDLPVKFAKTFAESAKDLWKGSNTQSRLVGRGLAITTAAVTILGLLNIKRGFKIDKQQSETKIDYTKDYVEN